MAATASRVTTRNEQTDFLALLKAEEVIQRREQRSMSKAERVLGFSDRGNGGLQKAALEGRKWMKRDDGLNFSFQHLRGAFKGRLKDRNFGHESTPSTNTSRNAADADSISSSPSPIFDPPADFDPSASTSTLPSTLSGPISPYHRGRAVTPYRDKKNALVENFVSAPNDATHDNTRIAAVRENETHAARNGLQLPPLDLPILASTTQESKTGLKSYLARNKSAVSIASTESEIKSKLSWRGQKGFGTSSRQRPADLRVGLTKNKNIHIKTGRNVRDWLKNAELNRSPSFSARPLDPANLSNHRSLDSRPFSSTSSSTIRTLTSHADDKQISPATDSASLQWPLPSKNFDLNSNTRRPEDQHHNVSKRNFRIESMLSLSSDEEEDCLATQNRKTRQSQGSNNSESTVVTTIGHKEFLPQNTTPNVPWLFDKRIPDHASPSPRNVATQPVVLNQTLSSCITTPIECKRPSFSPAKWQQNDETELSVKTLAALEGQLVSTPIDSGSADSLTRMYSPVNASRSIDAASRGGLLRNDKMPMYPVAELNFNCRNPSHGPDNVGPEDVVNDDLPDEELDVSRFPIPPHAHLKSIVPDVRVEFMGDSERLRTRSPGYEHRTSAMLLAASTASSASSLSSRHSDHVFPDGLDDFLDEYIQDPQDETTSESSALLEGIENEALPRGSALQRTRTISNVPIYVTQFEGSCDDSEAGCDDGIATFVFSNL